MRRTSLILSLAIPALMACRTGAPVPSAEEIVEGHAPGIVPDTVDDSATMNLRAARWALRRPASATREFWEDISVLDLPGAERSARSVEERTFAYGLRTLMASDPDASAVVFRALAHGARDNIVRMRARVGLTVALSWRSDWPAIAAIGVDPDTIDIGDVLAQQAAVERWAHALSSLPPPVIEVPDYPTTIRLRRSAFGTPVITVRVNGHEHEFWLDTGASLTLVSASVAKDADLKLAALDTLALGVVGGHIPARAVLIDSLAVGPVIARGISAALVSPGTLRLDHRVVNGVTESVSIDGVIGTDVLRALDLVLDAAAGTLTIRKPRPNPLAARNLYWIGYPVVRLVAQDGTPLILGLDTGAEGTYVTPSLLRKLPRTSVAMRRAVIGGLGSEVQRTSWIAREVALSDGDYALTLRNIPITSDRRWTFITFDGVIGSDVALHSRMHLDFVNGIFDVRRSGIDVEPVDITVKHQ